MAKNSSTGPQSRRQPADHPAPEPTRGARWQRLGSVLFAIDPRSLALFRIALGALLLVDLAIRGSDLGAMYADGGMFSRAEIRLRYTSVWNWSFHFADGSVAFQAALFGLAALFALALLVGWKTRWAALGSWLLLLSVQHRVPPILNAGDGLLRLLLLWGLFLPLHREWSLDARQARRSGRGPGPQTPVLSVASAAILLQMALMYLFSAFYKTNSDWFGGQVIAGTLAHDFYAKPVGELALRFPAVLTFMTWGVFLLEWAGPLLLFVPKHTARARLAIVAALAAMHLGIELCVTVGLFSFISLAGLTLFLPAEFWNHRWFARFSSPAVSTPQPSEPRGGPRAARRPALPWLREGVSALLLAYVLWLNFEGWLSHAQGRPSAAGSKFLNSALGLGQKWTMFEDTPSKDGWYVAKARLRDGSEVDLLQGGAPLNWNRPRFPAGMFPNHRWRKCFREMTYFDGFGYQVFREPVARYLCKVWNARHPADRQVAEFEFIYCTESRAGGPGTPPHQERLYPFAPNQLGR